MSQEITALPALRCEDQGGAPMEALRAMTDMISQNFGQIENIPMVVTFEEVRFAPREGVFTAASMRIGLNIIPRK